MVTSDSSLEDPPKHKHSLNSNIWGCDNGHNHRWKAYRLKSLTFEKTCKVNRTTTFYIYIYTYIYYICFLLSGRHRGRMVHSTRYQVNNLAERILACVKLRRRQWRHLRFRLRTECCPLGRWSKYVSMQLLLSMLAWQNTLGIVRPLADGFFMTLCNHLLAIFFVFHCRCERKM